MATALKQELNDRPAVQRETAPKPPRSKRRFVLPVVGLLALLGIGWGVKQWSYGRSHQSTEDAFVDGHLVPVLAKVSGYVQSVTVSDNNRVGAESLLVQIDPAEYKVRLAQAEADLAAARATAGGPGVSGQAEAAVQTAAGQRSSLDAQIGAARMQNEKAQSDLGRIQELAGKQIVSLQQLDAAKAMAGAAAANLLALERQAGAAGGSVTSAEAGVRLARARLQAADAAVENAKLQLSYTRIVAPTGGIVSRKQVEPGQLVQAGQPLLTLVADSGVYVTANFKETQLANLRIGQPVDIEIDAYPDVHVQGRVESVSAATGSKFALLPPDNATGNFTKVVQRIPVRIAIVGGMSAEHPLRPGMSTVVHVDVGRRSTDDGRR
jgi:membrane fusion protein (multidrug efflux system)